MSMDAKRAALWGVGVLAIAGIAGGGGYWLGQRGGPAIEAGCERTKNTASDTPRQFT